MLGIREILQKGDTAAVAPTSPTDFPMLNQLARTAGKTAPLPLLLAGVLALTGPLPVNAGCVGMVAFVNGQVICIGGHAGYQYVKGGPHPSSLKEYEENVHNGQSAVHNALGGILLNTYTKYSYSDAAQIYNYALTSEGSSEITRFINGNNGLHRKVPNALSNFNAWATANGFKTVKISSAD
jgi:hypothetical protein